MGAGSLARRMASWPICLGDAGRREDRVYRPGRTPDVHWDEGRRQGVFDLRNARSGAGLPSMKHGLGITCQCGGALS
jgi:hypothetical protein